MKVLHVCETLPGGPASYLNEILPGQVKLYGSNNVRLLIPKEESLYISSNFNGVIISYSKSGRNFGSLCFLWRSIQSAVFSYKPDIIHLHSSFAGALGRLALAATQDRPKIVYCAHCWSFDRSLRPSSLKIWTIIELFLTRWTDLIINISPHEESLLRDNRFPMDRVRLVVNGIEDFPKQAGNISISSDKSRDSLSLLFVGRMDKQKGFDLLVREFDQIDPFRVSLTVIGSKVVDDSLAPLRTSINYTGWITREKVSEYLTKADVLVMPSRWEGMPLAALEAFRIGVPILASNRGPFPYIIEDGVNGIIMDIDKIGFLGEAISRLETYNLNSMKAAARATYEHRFNSSRMCQELANVYEQLLKKDLATSSKAKKSSTIWKILRTAIRNQL